METVGNEINFRPLEGKILVKVIEKENQSISGIILSVKKEEKHSIGTALKVGDNCGGITENTKVLFNKHGVSKIVIEKVDYLVVNYEEILGTLQ